MGLAARSLIQQQYELQLERANPYKVGLIQARPYNCAGPTSTCFLNGRKTINANCPLCSGTGYLGVERDTGDPSILRVTATGLVYDDAMPPASDSYRIYGDIQTGHGLYGAGGDYIKLLEALGKQDTGDATLYCKMFDYDATTGKQIYPREQADLPRPDRLVSRYDAVYNAVQQIIAEIGSETIGRIFVLEKGSFAAVRGTHG